MTLLSRAIHVSLLSLIILLSLSLVSAQGEWYYDAEELVITSSVASSLNIEREPGASIDYIMANVTFAPKDRIDQDVLSRKVEPEAEEYDGNYVFRWDSPSENVLDFRVSTTVKTRNSIRKVTDKVEFPIISVPEDVKVYLQPTEKIDITPEIIKQSSYIAKGKDDLYEVVFELAKWTKTNIEYNLSTLTADVSQPASWVFSARVGVCDELTNLFISMCRSLGIPARFVSGIAYTEAPEFPEKWGAHGWAEVYFPNYGWIPFDPTYGEFGYVDPTHIILQESVDSEKAATYYEWRGRNFQVTTSKLEIDTYLDSSTGLMPAFVSLDLEPLYKKVGFGSYNLLEATVENPNNFYVATEFGLSKSQELEAVTERYQQVLLRPFEKKTLLWIVKLSEDLDPDYIYTFPVEVFSTRNSTSFTSFKSTERDKVYDHADVSSYYEQKTQESEKHYSFSVDLYCEFEKSDYLQNERAKVECAVSNTGNVLIPDLELCVETQCEIFELGITRSKIIEKYILLTDAGEQSFTATLESESVSKAYTFETVVFDKPSLSITELRHPESVDYGQDFNVSFKLKRLSLSVPKDLRIVVDKNGHENLWTLDRLENDRRFDIGLRGSDLVEGSNSFKVEVQFLDDFGREFQQEKSFEIKLENLTFGQKIKVLFNNLRIWFDNIF